MALPVSFQSIIIGSGTLSQQSGQLFYNGSSLTGAFIQSGDGKLYDSSGNLSVWWANHQLFTSSPSSFASLDYGQFIAYDSNQNVSINWDAKLLKDPAGYSSIDWQFRTTVDSHNVESIDWEGRSLFDGSAQGSLDWGNRNLLSSWSIDTPPSSTGNIVNYGFLQTGYIANGFAPAIFRTNNTSVIATGKFSSTKIVPSGQLFCCDSIEFICTYISGVTGGTNSGVFSGSYGTTINSSEFFIATGISGVTIGARDFKYSPQNAIGSGNHLVAQITTASNATKHSGIFVFKGTLVDISF